MDEQILISWRAPDYEYREKTALWYWSSIVIALFLLSLAIWQKNFFFALFIVIAEVLIISWANREPLEYELTINEKGLKIGEKKFYTWREMEAWSVHESGSHLAPIGIKFKHAFRPLMRILVPKDLLEEVEPVFRLFVPQTDDEHSLVDILGDYLGF